MNVLLSIKPEFAEKILDGEKQYEFRRTTFRDASAIDTVIMYATAPEKQIVGTFRMKDVLEEHPELLWNQFGAESGISDKSRFMEYFEGKEAGYAIEIDQTHELTEPVDPREHITDFTPPVSFQYASKELNSMLDETLSETLYGRASD